MRCFLTLTCVSIYSLRTQSCECRGRVWVAVAPHWHRVAHQAVHRAAQGWERPVGRPCPHIPHVLGWALWGIQIIGDCLPKFANSKFHCQDIVEALHLAITSNLIRGRGETSQGNGPTQVQPVLSLPGPLPRARSPPAPVEESSGVSLSCARGIAAWPAPSSEYSTIGSGM